MNERSGHGEGIQVHAHTLIIANFGVFSGAPHGNTKQTKHYTHTHIIDANHKTSIARKFPEGRDWRPFRTLLH